MRCWPPRLERTGAAWVILEVPGETNGRSVSTCSVVRATDDEFPAVNSGPQLGSALRPDTTGGSVPARVAARPAAATLRFQPTQREAWLVELDDDAARTEGDLCARHAAGLVLPRGWQLHNDLAARARGATRARARRRAAAGAASIARARRRRTATTAVELPGLSAVARARARTPTPAEPRRRRRPPNRRPRSSPTRRPEESEALAETLDAQTPLLRRAFSNVWLPDGSPPARRRADTPEPDATSARCAHVRGDDRDEQRDPGEHEQPDLQPEQRRRACRRAAGPATIPR